MRCMTGGFELIPHGGDDLIVKLPEHGLNGEAKDLFNLVALEIQLGRWQSITLDASEAAFVTLEAIGVLVTLRLMGERSEVVVDVSSPHPNLEQRLVRTGIIDLIVLRDSSEAMNTRRCSSCGKAFSYDPHGVWHTDCPHCHAENLVPEMVGATGIAFRRTPWAAALFLILIAVAIGVWMIWQAWTS